MPSYNSKEMSIMNAKAFIESLSHEDGRNTKESNILYAVLGNQLPYINEPTATTPVETDKNKQRELWREAIGAKKITTGDVSHVVPRYNWTSGTVYAQYRDSDTNLYTRPFYVITDENNVYKCLSNNKGVASTIKPADFSTLPFTLSDGYTWKFMYTISLGEADKFLTVSHMPVKTISVTDGSVEGDRQLSVQNAAVNSSIEIIETVASGTGYHQVSNGVVTSATSTTIRLSAAGDNPPSSVDNFYNGSSIYITSGTGSGQIRRVIDYAGSTKTFTVNSAFSTIANTDSRCIVSPTVTIRGDGQGALAYSEVNTLGQIANVDIISVGSQYSEADIIISANSIHGAGATANAIISPIGGHGKDPVRELGGDRVLLNVQFEGSLGVSANGSGYIPANTDFRSISILKDPILKVDANNNHVSTESIANTSNSPSTLRLTTRALISYTQMDGNNPVNAIVAGETLTNERMRLLSELGTLGFITELNPITRTNQAANNAVYGANGNVVFVKRDETETDTSFFNVYINNVQSFSNRVPFTQADQILKRGNATKVATISSIKGPEANTFSGEFIYTENVQKVTRDVEQTEDIKIILDF
jgi:hypothetical protein